ncbi:MAG: hypothetical protein WCI88_14375 [Chloroflexota bacterium]
MKRLFLFLIIGLVLTGCVSIRGVEQERKEMTNVNRTSIARFLEGGMDMNVTLLKNVNQGFFMIIPSEHSLRISENKEVAKIGSFVMGSLHGRDIFLLMPFGSELIFQEPESDMSRVVIVRSLLNSEDVNVTLMVHNNTELYPYFLNSYSILFNNQSPLPVAMRGYDNLGCFKMRIDQKQVAFLLIPS